MTASAVVQYLHHETFNKSPDDSAAAAGAGAADGAPMNGAAGAPTIRRALVKLVLACVLPMALAAAGLIDYVYSSERLGLTASAVNRARAIAVFARPRTRWRDRGRRRPPGAHGGHAGGAEAAARLARRHHRPGRAAWPPAATTPPASSASR